MAPNTDIIKEWIKINRKFSPIPALESLGIIVKKTVRGYSNSDLLLPIVLATLINSTLETVSEALRGILAEVPSADTILSHIRRHKLAKIERMINRALAESFNVSWRRSIEAIVAIDITDIRYYGEIKGTDAKHTRPRKGTHYAYRFMVASIVSEKGKFVLYVHLIKRNEDIKTALGKILEKIRRIVKISWLILDKGFFQVRVLRMLKRMQLRFVMAVPKTNSIKKLEITENAVTRYVVTSKRYGREPIWLVTFRDEKGIVHYITNKPVRRRRCGDVHRRYKKRWRIEVSFAVIKRSVAKTTSRSSSVRVFLFGISCILYNVWILTNFAWTAGESKAKIRAPETKKQYTHWLIIAIVVIIATYLVGISRLRLNNYVK